MTRAQTLALFPNATESTIRRNLAPADNPISPTPVAEPQRTVHPPLASPQPDQKGRPVKCLIRIESRRVQLQDPDNGVEKWHIDALRYAGILADDTTAEIEIQKWQTKVAHRHDEGTVITLTEIPNLSPAEAATIYSQTLTELKP